MNVVLDFSGIDIFWSIVDSYQAGSKSDDDLWTNLFDSPGYAALTKNEIPIGIFREVMEIALNPERAEEVEMSKGTDLERFVGHFVEVVESRNRIETALNKIKDRIKPLGDAIITLAKDFLPERSLVDNVRISFVFFGRDARGYESIVMDGLLATDLGELLDALLAHEYHHKCRDSVLCFDDEDILKEDKDVIWVLNQIHAEGLADQIDKPAWFFGENPIEMYDGFVKLFRMEVENAETTLQTMDEIITLENSGDNPNEQLGGKLKEILPISGHPIGYFMVKVITDAGFTDEMMSTIGNPFEFFKLYNKAVKKTGKEPLSDATINLISGLQKRYCQSNR